MTVKFLSLAPDAALRTELAEVSRRVIESGWYLLGPELTAFEAEFSAYTEAQYCVGTGSGLDALVIALRAAGIGSGDEVIVPAQTFIATWMAVTAVGATIIPVDVQSDSCNLDPATVRAAITDKTSAIIAVHLFGNPADMKQLREISDDQGLFLLEDAAQAHGASIEGRQVGQWGDAAAFSFYPGKNLGALGDGGAVVTNSEQLATDSAVLRNYGSAEKYVHEVLGYNSRLDELQAGFLAVKLKRLTAWSDQRVRIAEQYHAAFSEIAEIQLLKQLPDSRAVWHLYPILVKQRNKWREALAKKGIETLVHYPSAPYQQSCYQAFADCQFENAEHWANNELSLPIGPHLSQADVDQVIAAVHAVAREMS